MDYFNLLKKNLEESIEVKKLTVDMNKANIVLAALCVANAFKKGKKLLLCGNGGSAADSQHIAAEFVGRFQHERRPLPAIALTTDTSALTAIGNDYDFEQVFSRKVMAYGGEGDILIAISTSGNSKNVLDAVRKANEKGLKTISLVGNEGGPIGFETDITICVPSKKTARIQESHIFVAHYICELAELKIMEEDNGKS